MGWWGFGVMSGDTPLDCIFGILKFFDVSKLPEEYQYISSFSQIDEPFAKFLKPKIETLETTQFLEQLEASIYEPNRMINRQVFAGLAMAVGAKISPEMKALLLAGFANDEARFEYPERDAEMTQVEAAFQGYQGTERVIADTAGLMETIAAKLQHQEISDISDLLRLPLFPDDVSVPASARKKIRI